MNKEKFVDTIDDILGGRIYFKNIIDKIDDLEIRCKMNSLNLYACNTRIEMLFDKIIREGLEEDEQGRIGYCTDDVDC